MAIVKRKSPLKEPPLNYPGESVEGEISRLRDEKMDTYSVVLLFSVLLAAMEWMRYFRPTLPDPLSMTLFALCMVGYSVFQLARVRRKMHRLKLGRDGEKIVAEQLDELKAKGCRVLHDIAATGFNVDHVVISPQGIFAVETKTISKPIAKGKEAKVIFDGKKLLVDGIAMTRDPLTQAKANASWLQNLLFESTGKKFYVRPVVVFPGWYVENASGDVYKDVWVLNPKALLTFIPNKREVLKPDEVQMATYHLTRYIKTVKNH